MTAYLPEVGEQAARGSVAAVFADIRGTIGLPVVNLVYRHLATVPGRLEEVWAAVATTLRDPAVRHISADLLAAAPVPPVDRIPASALAAARVDAGALHATQVTLDAYGRGNSTNLLAVTALLGGVAGPAAADGMAPPRGGASPRALPAMVDPAAVSADGRALLAEMSAAVTGSQEPVIVPSLLRHLTQPPSLLALAWTVLRRPMTSAGFDRSARALLSVAEAALPALPFGVAAVADTETRDALGRFREAIPRGLLLGSMLRAALAEGLGEGPG